ncbi:MAG TPA: 50S ribosomal protein L21, partial [Candidatus Saccharimonadales bacterium]
ATGGKQYLVSEDETLEVELIKDAAKTLDFKPLLIIDDQKVSIGKPVLDTSKVSAELVEADKQSEKVVSIRYKAKKRVHKVRGHRQRHSVIKITKIS